MEKAKVLRLPNPLAACFVKGFAWAIPKSVLPFVTEGRYLVYASRQQVENLTLPIEWVMEAENLQRFGKLPHPLAVADGAFLGYVSIFSADDSTELQQNSAWCPVDCDDVWLISEDKVFDEPIRLPLSEESLALMENMVDAIPGYQTHYGNRFACSKSRILELPVDEDTFFGIAACPTVVINITPEVSAAVLDDSGSLKDVQGVIVRCHDANKCFLKPRVFMTTELDENDEPALYPSLLQPCGRDTRRFLHILLR